MKQGTDKHFPALEVRFTSYDDPKQVPVVGLVFESWKIATVCYDVLVENFENRELYLNFTDIQETEIEFEILKVNNNEWVVDARVPFNKEDFDKFCYYVEPTGTYAVLFGSIQEDGGFVISGSSKKPNSIMVFNGYKK